MLPPPTGTMRESLRPATFPHICAGQEARADLLLLTSVTATVSVSETTWEEPVRWPVQQCFCPLGSGRVSAACWCCFLAHSCGPPTLQTPAPRTQLSFLRLTPQVGTWVCPALGVVPRHHSSLTAPLLSFKDTRTSAACHSSLSAYLTFWI